MAAADAPITVKEILTLSSIGIKQEFITSTNVTMESEKYICVHETSPQNSVVIVDMSMPMKPFRRPTTADSALVNPNSKILALKASLPGTTQDHLQVFNIEMKVKMKSCQMLEHVSFWKWITAKLLGLVTEASVYHWSIEGDSEPVKMFNRTSNLANNQIIDYRCDISQKWLVLIGTAPSSPERPQLINGNMQLFSVDQQLSQALEAHAASFASFKVSGNENPSTLISFATTKVTSAGQITSKLHVVELGAQSGRAAFTRKQSDLLTPPDLVDDFPVAIQISNRYSLIHVITKLGLLYVHDLETATAVYRYWISLDPVILTSEASYAGGFYAINRRGQVLLATINESSIVSFIINQLNNLELAVDVAKRGNLPGAENLVVQRFQKLFAQTRYKEAAELAAESPQGILRTPDTIAKFQSVPVQGGQTPPILQYFGTLLTKGKLNAFESLELSQLVIYRNKKNLLENWLAEDKLECTEELGDLVNTLDRDLAVKIYIKASATSKVVQCFQELFAQTKYEEAAELAAESPEGILRTPETVAKFKCIPLQGGGTPLLQYFITLLGKGKLNAFESIELSRLVVVQNQKNVLENYIAEDKLECTEELGDIVKTVDNDLALKIYVKAGAFSKCFQELFAQTKYKEAAELAVKYQGILRNSDTVAKFQSVQVQDGQAPPLLQYFGTLLTKGKLNAFESLELSRLVVNQNERNLLDNWLADDKLECTEELKELVKVIQYFHVLFAQTKYKEAAKLAIEYQGVLRTLDTVAKFQSVPVQAGQTPPLLQYFETLLIKGKLNAFESIELSRLVVNQKKKNLLENWLAKDKLECSEELGDIVRTVDNDLALKIYMKAEATSKVVKALSERREFDKLLIYSKQVGYTPPDFLFLLQTILRSDFQGAVKFALIMSRMEGGCPVDYNTITDLFLQKNLIREATTFLLEVLKPDLAEHAFLQTKVLEINIFTFPNVVDAILAKEMFSHYDRPHISQLCEEAGLYVKRFCTV